MIKKLATAAVLLAALAFFCGCADNNAASSGTQEQIQYYVEYGEGYKLILPQSTMVNDAGTLTLPATYKGKYVLAIGEGAFADRDDIKNILFRGNLAVIEDGAFEDCDSLVNLVLPESLEVIGDGAFRDCSELKNVSLGENVSVIGSESFKDCDELCVINFPDSLTEIGSKAFFDCPLSEHLYLPSSVKSADDAFGKNPPKTAYKADIEA